MNNQILTAGVAIAIGGVFALYHVTKKSVASIYTLTCEVSELRDGLDKTNHLLKIALADIYDTSPDEINPTPTLTMREKMLRDFSDAGSESPVPQTIE